MNPSLQNKIDRILANSSSAILKKARSALSENYRSNQTSLSVFSDEAQRLAYLAARFPATYAVCSYVLRELQRLKPDFACHKVLDLGAGPATASLAAQEQISTLKEVNLVERSSEAIALGKELLTGIESNWIHQDLERLDFELNGDLAILSYSLGELEKPLTILEKLSEVEMIAVIEPGTPRGYQTILQARDFFIDKKYTIIAPCPHQAKCPLKGGDWCHFFTRLQRDSLHRMLKEGSRGYEDEKFSYLLVEKRGQMENRPARILRHPEKGSGFVKLKLCTPEGEAKEQIVTRKQKELYKKARKSKWGEGFPKEVKG